MTAGILSILRLGAGLTASLPQSTTNGQSSYGTLHAPKLPKFLTNNPLPNGYPWGKDTADGTNPYQNAPKTGVIRSYDFTIKRAQLAPDGYLQDVIVVNDAYPGPLIEANWGDTIQVTVHNQIDGPAEGTSLHWHGLLQTATPWYDGVPSVQQCPIAPGKSFTYSFIADLYGTSWYHSHFSSQYAGGLHGPIVIHGPSNMAYDTDLGPVFLNDWYHRDYYSIVKQIEQAVTDPNDISALKPPSDNNLINGKMDFDCSIVTDGTNCTDNAGLSRFKFTSGKSHRLRLINSGAEGTQKFSIDNHKMWVIANDFVPVKPYQTTIVTLGAGQRTDVVVKATGKSTDAVWMRSTISTCSPALQPYALAVIYYENANTTAKPATIAWADTTDPCANDDLSTTTPYFKITPNPSPAKTQNITITGGLNATNHFNFQMNGRIFRGDYNDPLLLLAQEGNTTFANNSNWSVFNMDSARTVRLVLYNDFSTAHPMHLHGHNFYVLSVGAGEWDGSTIVNPNNPQRRDVQMIPGNGHLVIQYDADNPGVWSFHCHYAWHTSTGLYINILERPKDIKQMQIPQVISQTCDDWKSYTDSNVPDQIDSGV